MPDLPKSVKEHFKLYAPWDGSRPDAGYVEAPAPHPRKHYAPLPGTARTDGLQAVDKVST